MSEKGTLHKIFEKNINKPSKTNLIIIKDVIKAHTHLGQNFQTHAQP